MAASVDTSGSPFNTSCSPIGTSHSPIDTSRSPIDTSRSPIDAGCSLNVSVYPPIVARVALDGSVWQEVQLFYHVNIRISPIGIGGRKMQHKMLSCGNWCTIALYKIGHLFLSACIHVYIYKFKAVAGRLWGIWPGQDTSRSGSQLVKRPARRPKLFCHISLLTVEIVQKLNLVKTMFIW
jgi:hypothetical protein